MQISEVLNRAADLLRKRGWDSGGNGWFDHGDGAPLCTEGAIKAAAAPSYEDARRAIAAVTAYLGLPRRVTFRSNRESTWNCSYLWVWNDVHPEDATEVIATLRAAAVIEAAKESASVEVSA